MAPGNKQRFEVWLKQSQFDLAAAQDSLNNRHFEWVCYQATQSVEKSLKAVVVHGGYLPPKTHKLGVLVSMANRSNNQFLSIKFNFRKIESFTFISRYPFIIPGKDNTPHEIIDRNDAETCLTIAKDIYGKVRDFLSHIPEKPGSKPLETDDYYFNPEEVQTRINNVILALQAADQIKLEKIILFGSFARERTRPRSSTMDLLIIGDTSLNFIERIHYVRELTKGAEPIIEPLVYTSEEFNDLLKEEGEGFLESAIAEGKAVYEKKAEQAVAAPAPIAPQPQV